MVATMLERPFRFEIGPYWILLPRDAEVTAEVTTPSPGTIQMAFTNWTIKIGRFQIFAHLDPLHDLGHLKSFGEHVTRRNVVTPSIEINGVPGVTHGGYEGRTWIDWWFKKGDTMICMTLQSVAFPHTQPTDEEIEQHKEISGSIKYCCDNPTERAPNWSG